MIPAIKAEDLLTEEEIDSAEEVYNVYSYFDTAVNVFGQPFFSEEAPINVARGIKFNVIKGKIKPEVAVGTDLYHLGVFHNSTGKFELIQPVKLISLAKFIPEGALDHGTEKTN